MVIKASTEKEYLRLYLNAIQSTLGLAPREVDVAVEFIHRRNLLSRAKGKIQNKNTRESFNIIKELMKKESITSIAMTLEMSFPVFKNYISSMKRKGFFYGGDVNADCIPPDGEVNVILSYVPE